LACFFDDVFFGEDALLNSILLLQLQIGFWKSEILVLLAQSLKSCFISLREPINCIANMD